MSAADLLDLPEVRRHFSPISVARYHTFSEFNQNGRRTELVRGVVLEKMPKIPRHASIAKLLYDTLNAAVPKEFSVRQDQPITLSESEPEPDIAVVHGPAGDYWEVHPTTAALIIEIAVTSLDLDREKAAIYAEAGVEEYWIVLPRERKVEVYRQPHRDAYAESVTLETGLLTPIALPSVAFQVEDFWRQPR